MEVGKLNVEYRNETGKSAVRRLRNAGKIPAICYGPGKEPMPLSVDPTALVKSLDPVKKTNTVLSLTVEGVPEGGGWRRGRCGGSGGGWRQGRGSGGRRRQEGAGSREGKEVTTTQPRCSARVPRRRFRESGRRVRAHASQHWIHGRRRAGSSLQG